MNIPFTKAHGARNDFLLTWRDQLPSKFDAPSAAVAICDRHTGAGADGWLLISKAAGADGAIDLWNSDGSRSEISGNGTRRAGGLPIKVETVIEGIDEDGALRVANVQDRRVVMEDGRVKLLDGSGAHVHLERKSAAVALEQAEVFQARAGEDTNVFGSGSGFHEECGGAAGAVAGDFGAAAVGIPEIDCAVRAGGF